MVRSFFEVFLVIEILALVIKYAASERPFNHRTLSIISQIIEKRYKYVATIHRFSKVTSVSMLTGKFIKLLW